jgi:amidase
MEHALIADRELAAGRDRGLLHGIPVLIKDNILTGDGMAATAGAAALSGFLPEYDAPIVRGLRDAGAIVLGKTNLTEFADYVSDVMPSAFSGAGGIVRNPHGFEYGRGQGSSVGSAAGVAASLAMFAIGTETGNSIQTPAAYSSVAGYKPSVGVLDCSGIFPLVPSQDSPGPLARSVGDAALVAALLSGGDARKPAPVRGASLAGMRIGVPRRQIADRPEFEPVMPLFEQCLSRLSQAGAMIVDPCDMPSADRLAEVRSSVFRTEFKHALNAFLDAHRAPCGIDSLQTLIAWNQAHPSVIPYGQSLLIAANATGGLEDPGYLLDRAHDIALSRTEGIDAALAIRAVHALVAPMGAAAKCTGKAGAPVVAIPAGLDARGAPFGISAFAATGDDRRLLSIAVTIEQVIGARQVPVF